jgi:TonB family protein
MAQGMTPVSLANTASPLTGSEKLEGTPTTRPNPVALESPVTVTGARPSSEGTRDLFTEETKTILVFVDGAVIQLAATVSVGQLLFLTNKKSNEAVVCQILHKRVFRPTVCYVEVQFTEQKRDFWGVVFPKAKAGSAEFTSADHVAAKEMTEDDPGTPVAARSEQEVEQLKTQVETLRRQLRELEQQKAHEATREAAPPQFTGQKMEQLAPVNDPVPEQTVVAAGAVNEPENKQQAAEQALLMPAAKAPEKTTLRWAVPMALPNFKEEDARKTQEERDPLEDLLPKPELDFSKIPSAVYMDESDPRSIYKQKRIGAERIRLIALVIVLGAVVGIAGYAKAWRLIPAWKDAAVAAGQWVGNAVMRRGSARTNVPALNGPAKSAEVGAGNASGSGATPRNGASSAGHGGEETGPASATKPLAAESAVDAGGEKATEDGATAGSAEVVEASRPEPSVKNKTVSTRERSVSRKQGSDVAAVPEEKPATVVPSDAPVIAAKLVHTATPVYPPDAMLNYITGDVKAELEVDADGKVGEVRVLSGPKALRDAAVEALKKYQYAPATQGGKTVASKTTATVKFWFDP